MLEKDSSILADAQSQTSSIIVVQYCAVSSSVSSNLEPVVQVTLSG